jgi:hypothetical protein
MSDRGVCRLGLALVTAGVFCALCVARGDDGGGSGSAASGGSSGNSGSGGVGGSENIVGSLGVQP